MEKTFITPSSQLLLSDFWHLRKMTAALLACCCIQSRFWQLTFLFPLVVLFAEKIKLKKKKASSSYCRTMLILYPPGSCPLSASAPGHQLKSSVPSSSLYGTAFVKVVAWAIACLLKHETLHVALSQLSTGCRETFGVFLFFYLFGFVFFPS